MNNQFLLPDGSVVGTGLQIPASTSGSDFPVYEDVGPMLTMDQIRAVAAVRPRNGRNWFDARYCRNQRSHGSCQGFASAGAVTRARVRRGYTDGVILSGAYAYSLVNDGRDDGSLLSRGLLACQDGYATEETVPWNAIYPSQYDVAKARAEAARYKAFEVTEVRSERAYFSALASDFDVVVAVHVEDNFFRMMSDGTCGSSSGPGNHAVVTDGLCLIGDVLAADHMGSWGPTNHDNGRALFTWDRHLRETTRWHVFYAIRSSSDDPRGANPPPVAA